MCCQQLNKEIDYGRFEKTDSDVFVVFKSCDYDEDYGHDIFREKIKINFCPFCGSSLRY